VLNILNEASDQEPGQLFVHGLVLLLVKASHALLDRLRTGFDIEGVLDDVPGDARHFCQAPRKYVLVALGEVNGLAFLFGVQTGPDMHDFGRVPSINLHGLGVLVRLENTDVRGVAGLNGAIGSQRLSSHNSAVVTVAVARSMLPCSETSTRCILDSKVITPTGPGILSLR
jgi:hypothetical protein